MLLMVCDQALVMVEVAVVGYCIVVVVVGDCNIVTEVVALCKLLFVILFGVLKLS